MPFQMTASQKRQVAKEHAKLRREGKMPPPPHIMPSPHLCGGHMRPLGTEGKKYRSFYKSTHRR